MQLSPLGIDVSKAKFAAALLAEGGKLRHRVFPNTGAGYAQLSAWLAMHQARPVHACLETTGTYGEALAAYLHAAGHLVSGVNPDLAPQKRCRRNESSSVKLNDQENSNAQVEIQRRADYHHPQEP